MNNQEAMLENMDVAQLEELRARVKARGNKAREGRNVITPLSREAALPLSFAQQRLWFLTQLDGSTDAYHIPLALRLSGPLDRDAWRQALNALFARHEALRSVFVTHDGEPVLHLLDPSQGMPCHERDLCDVANAEQALARLCAEESRLPFDLGRGPLVRAQLIRLASDQHVFLLTQHHTVSDGWSMSILLRELQALYAAFVQGTGDPLPALAIQYPDYAAWQRQWLSGERLQAQADFWRRSLADAPTLISLPTDHPRPAQQSFAGASVPIVLDAALSHALRRLSQQRDCTLFMTLMAAWAVVLARLSGQNDLVIGTPSANRRHRQVEPLIGFFVNTLALHIDLTGEPSVAALMEQLRLKALAAQDHQDLPFEQVVDIVQPPRRLDHTPLFQVMFAWQNNEEARLELPGLQVQTLKAPFDHVKYDLELVFGEQGETIEGELNYATALFDRASIERQRDYLLRVLRAMVADASQPVSRIDLLGEDERELLLHAWNRTEAPYPDTVCIHQLFEQQVQRAPDASAVVGQDQALSYGQLNEQANRLAHHLIALGVKPDDRVAVCMERGPGLLAALLAILKAGGAYVPLDAAYASERLNGTLRDAAPVLLLSDAHGRMALDADVLAALPGVDLDDTTVWESQSEHNPHVQNLASHHLAYVIYTSGSSGTPKGVMVEHCQLANLVHWHTTRFELAPAQRVAVTAGVAFDAFTWEIWPSLSVGGTLLISGALAGDPLNLLRWWQAQTIHSGFLATALAEMALDGPWLNRGPRYLLTGGDRLTRLPPELPETTALINNYGPTETTVVATSGQLFPQGESPRIGALHIGRPIANTRIYLLDTHRQPVPLGAAGEIYIGGAGVARGYLHRPELTAERFLPDPFVSDQNARMYKTGDLARYLPDGNLEFIGRNDQQVKIRGFRIEPGEIEARLLEHEAVREAVVTACTDKGGDPRLVAYIVVAREHVQQHESLLDRVHSHLDARLPAYMVPAAFVILDALPLTPNGKLDRKALPAPDDAAFARQTYETPQGEVEKTLAALWEELLGISQVGRRDNFFALGGHSLLAVRLMERLRRLGLGAEVRALFAAPELADLAAMLGQHQEARVPPNAITPETTELTPTLLPLIDLSQDDIGRIVERVPGGVANIQDIYALSPLQDGILFHHLFADQGDPYLLVTQLAFADRSLLDRYLAAVQQVVDRHDIFRTAFLWEQLATPAQVVLRKITLPVIEIELDAADGPIQMQLAQRYHPRHHRLDLTQAPLLRFVIAREPGTSRWQVLQLLHHLIGDHSTLETLHDEVQHFMAGHGDRLLPPQPYRHLIAQARGGLSLQEHEHFFRSQLADIDEPTAPFGLTNVYHDGHDVTQAHIPLPGTLNERLRTQARRQGVSLASLFHLAWGQVLARTSGRTSVVFGTVLFGRMHAGEGADRSMGLFINTLPLRLDMDHTGVADAVRLTHVRLAELLRHEHASLALAQRCSGVAAPAPLFSTLLNYRHNTEETVGSDTSALAGIEWLSGEERTNYPLALSVEDFGQTLGLTAQAIHPLDPARICALMQRTLEQLVDALEQAPQQPVHQLDVLPTDERELLLQTWNRTDSPYPATACIHQLFEQHVQHAPDAIAVAGQQQTLTYRQLNEEANRLAHHLIGLGIKPDDRVAVCMERSPNLLVSLFAILKAGGAYVPLDPAYPSARLGSVLHDAQAVLLLSDRAGREALGDEAVAPLPGLDLQTDNVAWSALSATNPVPGEIGLAAHHLAYVIYTSGSTGTPKGVMVEHRNVVHLAHAQHAYFQFAPHHRIAQFASISFDASLADMVMALTSGAGLYLPAAADRQTGTAFLQYMARHAITHATLPPALLQGDETWPSLAHRPTLLLAGEAPSLDLVRRLSAQATVVNAYGPTECTVWASSWRCPSERLDRNVIPIGRPIANARIYLLDEHGQPVPLGAVGEIHIGGTGVARGYLHQAALTAERFLTDPFHAAPGARMYKTGDLARYLPDGELEFLGRSDQQVKIRGFRIEPGEIEARLLEHPAVREAAVVARTDQGTDKRLVAYLVAADPSATMELATDLRTYLDARLPSYMVPGAFVTLDALPLTPNGKLDRKALPAPDDSSFARQAYEAPQGEVEQTLAALWKELLGISKVGRHDNFFALGGHSLLAVRLMERLRRLGLGAEVRALFTAPGLADLAAVLGQHREARIPPNQIALHTTRITPTLLPLIDLSQHDIDRIVEQVPGGVSNIQDIYALSPLQDGILFHHLFAERGDPYLLATQLVFAERELLDRYLAAMQRVVDRHDILRTAFLWEHLSTPVQVVLRQATLPVIELALDTADGPIQAQLAQRFHPRHHRLDLGQAPLLRFAIAREPGTSRWQVLQLLHHLIGDHSTLETLHDEVQHFMAGQGERLLPPQPFRHLIAQARGGLSPQQHEDFFRRLLADIDEPTAPFGLTDVYHDGHDVTQAHIPLPGALNERLRTQARRQGVSLASLFHLAWGQVLARTSGRTSVVFGTVLFGRMHAGEGADRSMGLFINTLPLRLDMDHTGVADAVRLTHARLAELLRHEHASLALAQRCSGVAAPAPLFSTLLNYRHNTIEVSETAASPLHGIEWLDSEERTNYPLVISVEDSAQTLGLTAQAIHPLDPAHICALMQQALHQLVEALEYAPQQPVHELDVLPPGEREQLLQDWNRTDTPYPDAACIHHLFEQQVERTPDAIAVVGPNHTLSYLQLNQRANRLAHHLLALGIKPDQRVAVCMERSANLLVALFAILKAGGAYVPLDPAYPGRRLGAVLRDAAPVLLLSDAPGRAALDQNALTALTVVDLDHASAWEQQPDSNPRVGGLTSDHLAYVIYTSGSTGTPKGVMVEHRQLVASTCARTSVYQADAQTRYLLLSSMAFDSSVASVFGTLTSGGALHVLNREAGQDPQAIALYLLEGRITCLLCVPSLADLILTRLETEVSGEHGELRDIIVAGEPCPVSLARKAARLNLSLHNEYGPTEATVWATVYRYTPDSHGSKSMPIGRPIPNARIYLLDEHGQPVPRGAVGEIHIGGAGVARGYLDRTELTAERFLTDPFHSAPGARMYKTGDLARYLPDGELEFLGRSDQQVKIRGFRIETGEIEAHLLEHPAVREAAVVARADQGTDKRLVAYLVAEPSATADLATDLRGHLDVRLPDYMVPAAFVTLDALPLTPNGKLDRKALPAPDDTAFARHVYEAPQGDVEQMLAALWEELLGVNQVGRHDNFFALGGHSLLAIRLMERLRNLGLGTEIRALFATPGLADLAAVLGRHQEAKVPPNAIAPDTAELTPALLPLIDLSQDDIDRIVAQTPGGVAHIQDIYALSPLQDGILFHHLLAERGDPYLSVGQMSFADRALLDRYLAAVQCVVDRHDILRTAFLWEHLSTPAQVVRRQATLPVIELELNPADGPIQTQLAQRYHPRHHRLDLTQAPLLRFVIAREPGTSRWQVLQLLHHLIGDHATLETLHNEVQHFMAGHGDRLLPPQPYRHLIAQARGGLSLQEHEHFFRSQLADIDEPTAPFGLTDVYHDGRDVTQAHIPLPGTLNERLRTQARRQGVSLASLFHLAWGQVLARTSGRTSVVFGTVLFGRMHAGEGADRSMGLFINTLPLRLDMDHTGVADAVRLTHTRLAELLRHEHASLALAQRCSGVAAPAPLFSTLLNYRHNAMEASETEASPLAGIEWLNGEERTNYPLALSVEDSGQTLGLTAQAIHPLDPARICALMQRTLEQLVDALEQAPQQPVHQLDVLPPDERELLLQTWNRTDAPYPDTALLHQLFEQQAQRVPDAIAVAGQDRTLTYQQLNTRANRLAHHLIALGVKPDDRITVCMERSPDLLVGLLAILKAGGAYVPLDPAYPSERLRSVLRDAASTLLLIDAAGRTALGAEALTGLIVLDLDDQAAWERQPDTHPKVQELASHHLAYVIYTSGSTGTPKGVMVEHRNVVHLAYAQRAYFQFAPHHRIAQFASIGFDASLADIVMALASGASLHLPAPADRQTGAAFMRYLMRHAITHATLPPALLQGDETLPLLNHRPTLLLAGEAPSLDLVRRLSAQATVVNAYGPTECTVWASGWTYPAGRDDHTVVSIGRPITHARIYLLDQYGQPVPLGAVGEIHIGGAGVARGYLHQPALTAERFLSDPFHAVPGARMYKTGDLARYLPNGELEFLGRSDQQVKIRGFRIEPGEIEARLLEHPAVREAAVVARIDQGTDKRLVAYLVAVDPTATTGLAAELRAYLDVRLPDYMVPAAFIVLDALPLTPHGKLDRKALPAPDDAAFARQAYAAPQGEIEQILAALWEELLGIGKVSRHDNFFALGGHSLLAMRMVNRVRQKSHALSIGQLYRNPVLADLAAQITSSGLRPTLDRAIPVRPAGDQHPLFFVPTGLGDYSYAFELARDLTSTLPVHVLPWPIALQTQDLSIESMAINAVSMLRQIQPQGPYRLAGYSSGGMLAYAIAERLLSAGEDVSFVGLIDTHLLDEALQQQPTTASQMMLEWMESAGFADQLRSGRDASSTPSLDLLIEQRRRLGLALPSELRGIVDDRLESTQSEAAFWKQTAAFTNALWTYRTPRLPLAVHQFYAEKHEDSFEEILTLRQPARGWERILPPATIHTYPIPGTHLSMMSDRVCRAILGAHISQALKSIQAG